MFKNEVCGRYHMVESQQLGWSKYVEQLDNEGGYDNIIDEMYRSDGFDENMMMDDIGNKMNSSYVTTNAKNNRFGEAVGAENRTETLPKLGQGIRSQGNSEQKIKNYNNQ